MELNLNQLGAAAFKVKARIENDDTLSLNRVNFRDFEQAVFETLAGSLKLRTRKTEAGIVPDYQDPQIIELKKCICENRKILVGLFQRDMYE